MGMQRGNHREGIAYIEEGVDWNITLPALRYSEMQDRGHPPARKHEAGGPRQGLRWPR